MAIRTAVNRALTAITALPTAAALTDGNLTLLTTATASSSATLDFTSSINSTYNSYLFKYIDIHPATDSTKFTCQFDTGTNTSYNQAITSTFFRAAQDESATTDFGYKTAEDQAQGTAFQTLTGTIGNGNDESCAGILHLFDPASTTFVKHFMGRAQGYTHNNYAIDEFVAGYINTTTAITRIRFKFASGNIDAGTIKMYGVGPKQ
tara:strand:- start:628 stop:1245 length:618 start_codon:yes stop_codon:yes gene_type:complete